MSLDNPTVLQERVRPLVVPEIDALSRILHDVTRAGIRGRTIAHELLEVRNVVRSHYTAVS